MELQQALNQRKSVRSYTGELPTQEQLDAILTAGYEAPVGMNRYDTIHLTIITNKELLGEIDSYVAEKFGHPELHPLYGAPVFIIVSSNQEGNVASANVSDIIENMSLECVEQGLGSCFIYGALNFLVGNPELVAKLNLPEGFKPVGSLILGKSDDAYAPREIPESRHFSQNVID